MNAPPSIMPSMPMFTMPERSLAIPLSAPSIIGTAPRTVALTILTTAPALMNPPSAMLLTLPPSCPDLHLFAATLHPHAIYLPDDLISGDEHQDQRLDNADQIGVDVRLKLHLPAARVEYAEQKRRGNDPKRAVGCQQRDGNRV